LCKSINIRVDIAKLKEIGVELKIAGMQSSQKPQTILDKINAYIDEYENVGAGEGEGEEGNTPEGEENSAEGQAEAYIQKNSRT